MPRGLNKKSLSQMFRDAGEVFDENEETYKCWHKRCVLKYFPDKRKAHYDGTNKLHMKKYHCNKEFKKLCKIECYN